MSTKQCSKCKKTKPFTEFNQSNPTSSGYNSWCKQCSREASKRHSETPSGIYSTTKGSVNYYHNTTVDISREDFIVWYNSQIKICGYCDIPEDKLNLLGNYYADKCNRLTVDRMNNDFGYREDNMVMSCYRCNMTKGDVFTYEEFREIEQKYLKPKWMLKEEVS